MNKPIWKFNKVIDRPIHAVEKRLFYVPTGKIKSGGEPFLLPDTYNAFITLSASKYTIAYPDGHRSFIEIDREHRAISLSGEWWYRGTYTLSEHPGNKTLISYEVHNAAQHMRWMVPFITWRMKNVEDDFMRFAKRLEAESKD